MFFSNWIQISGHGSIYYEELCNTVKTFILQEEIRS